MPCLVLARCPSKPLLARWWHCSSSQPWPMLVQACCCRRDQQHRRWAWFRCQSSWCCWTGAVQRGICQKHSMTASSHGNRSISVANCCCNTHSMINSRRRRCRNTCMCCRSLHKWGRGHGTCACEAACRCWMAPQQSLEIILSFGGKDVQQLLFCWLCIWSLTITIVGFRKNRSYRGHDRSSILRITTLVEGIAPGMPLQDFANSGHPNLNNIYSCHKC